MSDLLYSENPEDPPYVGIIPDMNDPRPEPERCPIHAEPDSLNFDSWPCPVATEDDPPGSPTCGYFAEMIAWRTKDIESGNYFRMFMPSDEDYPGQPGEKRHYTQEFINNKPAGEPVLMVAEEPFEGFTQANSSECTRCQIPCGHCSWRDTCYHIGECHDFDWVSNPCEEHEQLDE